MQEREPNFVISSLSGSVNQCGIVLEVNIVRLEGEAEWTLEVVNPEGTSTVWDDPFESDDAAFAEFERTVAEEGMGAFVGNVVPFRR